MSRLGLIKALLLLLACVTVACGKKNAPLAPLYLVPSPVTDVSARRAEEAIRLRFVLPTTNLNGPGINLDRIEIYAVTMVPGDETVPNRELLTTPYLAGQFQVKPPPVEGESEESASKENQQAKEDKRPGPGEVATFAEQLASLPPTPRRRVTKKPTPPPPAPTATGPEAGTAAAPAGAGAVPPEAPTPATPTTPPPAETPVPPAGEPAPPASPPAPGPTTDPAAPAAPPGAATPQAAAAAAPPKLTQPVRVYVIRGVARNGRPGAPSGRITVPLGAVPDPPGGLKTDNTEKAIVVEWLPAVASVAGASRTYNVYKADAADEPLNSKPLDAPTYEHAGAALGSELCFRVRAVDAAGPVSIESAMSEPACVTPKDVFPPAAPKGLAAVSTTGAVQLIWDASSEADLAGYIVLRAEAPDETLQPLTPAPIRDTVFKDASVKPGVRYLYAIVAVDAATPPNRSAPSERAEAIAR